jgi:hypothetical protein
MSLLSAFGAAAKPDATLAAMERAGLTLAGEIDLIAAPGVGARLEHEVTGDRDVVVDAREVSFIDITGCRTLVEAAPAPAARPADARGGRPPRARPAHGLCGWTQEDRLMRVSEADSPGKDRIR